MGVSASIEKGLLPNAILSAHGMFLFLHESPHLDFILPPSFHDISNEYRRISVEMYKDGRKKFGVMLELQKVNSEFELLNRHFTKYIIGNRAHR